VWITRIAYIQGLPRLFVILEIARGLVRHLSQMTFSQRLMQARRYIMLRMFRLLLRAGVKIGRMSLLTVRGRTSGQPRTTPVLLAEYEGNRFLVSTYGESNWVRNLRAAKEAILTRGRRSERISVIELGAKEAAPFLKHFVSTVPKVVRPYFDVAPTSPLTTFEQEVARHPVFLVTPISEVAD
jgi:deazaflavin-dependent oxidoreductase (nitroreductase family)